MALRLFSPPKLVGQFLHGAARVLSRLLSLFRWTLVAAAFTVFEDRAGAVRKDTAFMKRPRGARGQLFRAIGAAARDIVEPARLGLGEIAQDIPCNAVFVARMSNA